MENHLDLETHHFILEAASQHQRIGAVVAAAVDPAYMWPVNARLAHLHSEFPGGSNRNTGNWSIMIGGNNGAFLSSPHTGHTLKLQPWQDISCTPTNVFGLKIKSVLQSD